MRICASLIRNYGTVVTIALTLAVQALAESGHAAVLDQIHIANFGRVSDSYYRGAQPMGDDFTALA